MYKLLARSTLLIALVIGGLPVAAPAREANVGTSTGDRGILWEDPTDIESRNLFDGSGGEQHAPHGVFTFLNEDLEGSNPKIEVRDEDGVKWKVKLGVEARPETAASRFVWAAGYFTDEDYFVGDLRVEGLPAHLKRIKNLAADGHLHDVRMERHLKGQEKLGIWRWRRDPFIGTREFNGLRTLMALMNNWDLKDENNAIYQIDRYSEPVYLVSDLGAAFGTSGYILSGSRSRGNLASYNHSRFIRRITPSYVDFTSPSRPTWLELASPKLYLRRVHIESVGKRIPRADAAWMGHLLGRLSPQQIRDAFRAAGYSPAETDGFTTVVEGRIQELKTL